MSRARRPTSVASSAALAVLVGALLPAGAHGATNPRCGGAKAVRVAKSAGVQVVKRKGPTPGGTRRDTTVSACVGARGKARELFSVSAPEAPTIEGAAFSGDVVALAWATNHADCKPLDPALRCDELRELASWNAKTGRVITRARPAWTNPEALAVGPTGAIAWIETDDTIAEAERVQFASGTGLSEAIGHAEPVELGMTLDLIDARSLRVTASEVRWRVDGERFAVPIPPAAS